MKLNAVKCRLVWSGLGSQFRILSRLQGLWMCLPATQLSCLICTWVKCRKLCSQMGGNRALPNGYAHKLRPCHSFPSQSLLPLVLYYSTTWEQIVVVVEIRKDFALSCSLYMCEWCRARVCWWTRVCVCLCLEQVCGTQLRIRPSIALLQLNLISTCNLSLLQTHTHTHTYCMCMCVFATIPGSNRTRRQVSALEINELYSASAFS